MGDRVQVYIPRGDDPDHQYHGKTGEIIEVLEDDLSAFSENSRKGYVYTVEFNDPDLTSTDFRYDDLEIPDE